jgi:hypothetical protein
MGIYSSEVPDFKQAVEAILTEHGLIGDQSAGAHAPADQPADQQQEPGTTDQQPAGQQ